MKWCPKEGTWLLDLINTLFIGLLFLALFGAIEQEYNSAVLVGLIIYMVGKGVKIALNQRSRSSIQNHASGLRFPHSY